MDESGTAEILAAIAKLQEGMEEQKRSMSVICKFKDDAIKTFQNFEDYKESRKGLPAAIVALETRTAKCNIECEHHTGETKEYFKKTDFLMTWYGRGAALLFSINVLIAIMVLLSGIVDIQYIIKP
jgi:hypothetical protein